ncbi:MAG: phosphoribosylformylglycinamidine synthase subunit PurL [Thaumarchaeota archaeon]|nr:phosphoribosylformylglycinamidine synthase subunit PurL [Nitrososphaerota archaeon]
MTTTQSLRLVSVDNRKAFQLCRKLNTGLSLPEVSAIRAHFKKLGREPTEIELHTIAQTWSEHCFHKVFKSKIKLGSETINGLFNSFIKRATEEIGANWVVSSFSDNAGIIKFEETVSIAAKVETHNHPSAIEPFGGAATGVGGVIRDILGVWAEPIGLTNILFFGDLDFPYKKLPLGIMHPRYLLSGVVSGVGSYGNNMGIPTVNGGVYFDDSYTGYTLVFCGCIGLAKNRNYARSAKPGDVLVIAGGRTGRDGIHGVNFASEKIEGDPDTLRPAVQIPNPITEEKLARAVLEIGDRRLASAITDLGGGGLSSGVCEIAKSFGCGAEVDLASVPLKSSDLEPWEIWISESQERMLLVVPPQTLAKTLSIFESEEIEAGAIGTLTDSRGVLLKDRNGELGKIDLQFLFSPPLPRLDAGSGAAAKKELIQTRLPPRYRLDDLSADLLLLLGSPNISSKEGIVRTYDFEVKGNTVIKPFQYPRSGPNDAAVLKPVRNSEKGLSISCGFNPRFSSLDPYWMAASSIDEAVRNNVAVGGRRIALLDNFAWGDPGKPGGLRSLVKASKACYDVSKAFETPFISGKDSLYNQTPLGEILPTLVITALGIIPEISKCVSADFKNAGDSIYLVGNTLPELGGSEFFKIKKVQGGIVPKVDLKRAPAMYKAMSRVMDLQLVRACHDLSQGGLAVALAEMCFASNLGAKIVLEDSSESEILSSLFSESNSRFLVEVQRYDEDKFEKTMKDFPFTKLGVVQAERISIKNIQDRNLIDLSTDECYNAWTSRFSGASSER